MPLIAVEAQGVAPAELSHDEERAVEELIAGLQASMWVNAGLLREESRLQEGLRAHAERDAKLAELVRQGKRNRRLAEALALNCVAGAILHSALARTESRGAHFRNDYPQRDDEHFRKHSVLCVKRTRGEQITFQEW